MKRRKKEKLVSLRCERMSAEGASCGESNERTVCVYGAYPGEHVCADIRKRKGGVWHGVLNEVTEAASYRCDAREEHYLSCSPWQTLVWEQELQFKQDLMREIYGKHGIEHSAVPIITDGRQVHYRNKMECRG